MTPLWTADEIAAATGGEACRFQEANGIAIDSAAVMPGDLFIALDQDGAAVETALARGAAAAMVHRAAADFAGAPLVLVEDVAAALQALATAARQRSNARIIVAAGIEEATVQALGRVLERQGRVWCPAAASGPLALPLALARMPADDAFAVFDLAKCRLNEIARWCAALGPRVAMIDDGAAESAAAIFPAMAPHAVAVLDHDAPNFATLAAAARARGAARVQSYGAERAATVHLVDCHLHQTASAVIASVVGEIIDYCVAFPGRAWVARSLAVLCAVNAADGDIAAAAAAMGTLAAAERRAGRARTSLVKG
jgi:UDP-N-acetylmuramoyl-tripeptide--D-alanyl-D-alanine ligase